MSRGGSARQRSSWPPLPDPLPSPVIDNHTHLPVGVAGDPGKREGSEPMSLTQHLTRSEQVGVAGFIHVACDLDTLGPSLRLAEHHPAIAVALGIHPNEAPLHAGVREIGPDGLDPHVAPRHDVNLEQAIAKVAELAGHERVCAIGETGLDYFRGGERASAVQRMAFRQHIALAKELDLPLQIHDRDAHGDIVEVLLADGAPARTVLHCFSGDVELARTCAANGWYASFAGPVTFKNNAALREALAQLPLELVLVETDAPYLTPAPHRGRPNAPWLMPLTVTRMAEVLEIEQAELCQRLQTTTREVYGTW